MMSIPILRVSLIPILNLSPCTLRYIHCQCFSQCKVKLTHSNQHLQHPENGPKIARNSEARWKLFKNIKTDDSSFKKERNQVD